MDRRILGNCCKGNCCGGREHPDKRRINRREFMHTTAIAAGGMGLAMTAGGRPVSAEAREAADEEAWRAWNEDLLKLGARRVYRGEELHRIAMPMGGIGAGQVYVAGSGKLERWQILNNFNSNANAPGSMFALWTRSADGTKVAKLLQEGSEHGIPATRAVEYSGEYPYAWLDYLDNDLPARVSLEVCSPCIPLNTKDSALPAVLFRFTVKNPSDTPLEAAVMASMPNLIGWDGYTELAGSKYKDYIGNVNEVKMQDGVSVLTMRTGAGKSAALSEPRTLLTTDRDAAYAVQLCENLKVTFDANAPKCDDAANTIFWLGDLTEPDRHTGLPNVLDAARNGAALIVTGGKDSLLRLVDQEPGNAWREALPFEWKTLEWTEKAAKINGHSPLLDGVEQESVTAGPRWTFKKLQTKPGARVLLDAKDGSPLIVEGPLGAGRIIVCTGPVHRWLDGVDRTRLVAGLLATASGTTYTAKTGWDEQAPFFGTMAFAAMDGGARVSAAAQWTDPAALWQDFADDGRFEPAASAAGPSKAGQTWNGALSVPLTLAPGEVGQVTFVLGWHFPNRFRDWRYGLGPSEPQYDYRLGNQYNNWFSNAGEVIDYVAANRERLDRETRAFHQTFYDSTLPHWLLDTVSANISTIRSPIYIWIEDGTVGGFEGTDACCPMNCTHVFNYAMSPAYLFPSLERKVRETDLLQQMNPDEHFIPHRTLLPMSLPRLGNEIAGPFHHALDGELGTILKTFREWRLCGDADWLAMLWPNAKKVMQHVMKDHDVNGDGVIRGEQPNTYDTHAYGSNTFIGSLYLTTLRAAAHMAERMGDEDFATECLTRFEQGREGYDGVCWNGEYYYNVYDAPEISPSLYEKENCWGPGCHADQLLGQWWAHIAGLGYVLPREHVHQALDAIYRCNWRRDMTGHEHKQRVFAEGNEKGLLNCTWPKGGRPEKPIKYCDEVWSGIEYEVAGLLLYEGKITEGLRIARAARDRYTGNQRNPWSEIECGGHYARAMAAHALLLAAAGLVVDVDSASLAFAPRLMQSDFKAFFSTSGCWGTISQKRAPGNQQSGISVAYGEFELRHLTLELPPEAGDNLEFTLVKAAGAHIAKVSLKEGLCVLDFEAPVVLRAGDAVEVAASWS